MRVRDGKTLTTDGPFAETREQLGGYYLVEAKDLDTALGLAARLAPAMDEAGRDPQPARHADHRGTRLVALRQHRRALLVAEQRQVAGARDVALGEFRRRAHIHHRARGLQEAVDGGAFGHGGWECLT